MNSGAKVDKSQVFESFSGTPKGAHMIKKAPLNMECEVVAIYDRPHFDMFLVKVVNTCCNEEALIDGKIDYAKVDPILFDMARFKYWHLEEKVADAYSVCKQYNQSK